MPAQTLHRTKSRHLFVDGIFQLLIFGLILYLLFTNVLCFNSLVLCLKNNCPQTEFLFVQWFVLHLIMAIFNCLVVFLLKEKRWRSMFKWPMFVVLSGSQIGLLLGEVCYLPIIIGLCKFNTPDSSDVTILCFLLQMFVVASSGVIMASTYNKFLVRKTRRQCKVTQASLYVHV